MGSKRAYLYAELAGTVTGMITEHGKKVYETKQGEHVSEKSMTFQLGNKWINVPSIHNGKKYEQWQLEKMLKENKINPTSIWSNKEDAEKAAKLRTNKMKSERIGLH